MKSPGRLSQWFPASIRVFFRHRAIRSLSYLLSLIAAGIVLLEVGMSTSAITNEQRVARDLGGFEASYAPADSVSLADATERAHASAPELLGLPPGARTMMMYALIGRIVDQTDERVGLVEADWASNPFPDRYEVLSGRVPSASGEAAISPALGKLLPYPELTVFSGNDKLRVVGVVEDRYATDNRQLLIGAGTTLRWASDPAIKDFVSADVMTRLLFSGGDASVTAARFDRLINPRADPDFSSRGMLHTRDELLGRPRQTVADKSVFFSYVPRVGLPVMAVVGVYAFAARRLRSSLRQITSLGVAESRARAGLLTAMLARCVGGVLVGATLAIPLSLLLSPLVGSFLDYPPAPWRLTLESVPWLIGSAAVACLVSASLLTFPRPALKAGQARSISGPFNRQIRWALAGVCAWLLVWRRVELSNPGEVAEFSVLMLALLGLPLPDLIAWWAGRPGRTGQALLSQRLLQLYPGRVAVTALAFALSVTVPVSTTLLLWSDYVNANDRQVSLVAPDHLIATDGVGGAHAPDGGLIAALQRVLPSGPIPTWGVGQKLGHTWDLAPTASDPRPRGMLFAVSSTQDAAALTGVTLTSEQVDTLERGGVLSFTGEDAQRTIIEDSELAAGTAVQQHQVASSPVVVNESLQQRMRGLMLQSSLGQIGVPTYRSSTYFTGLSRDQIEEARQAVIAAGHDAALLELPRVPDPFTIPINWLVPPLISTLLAFALITGILQGQLAALSRSANQLLSTGISKRWIRGVYQRQVATSAGLGLIISVIASVVPVWLVIGGSPGSTLAMPWQGVALTAAALTISIVAVIAVSTAQLNARMRHR